MNIQAPKFLLNGPLGSLSECHRRIENSLQGLQEIVKDAPVDGLPPPFRARLESLLDFFSTTVKRHTLDEEMSLFPRLRMDPLADLIIEKLEADHKRAESLYQTVETLGRDWLASGSIDSFPRYNLREAVEALHELSDEHFKIEEQRLFPLAAGRLDSQTLRQLGKEMALRREL